MVLGANNPKPGPYTARPLNNSGRIRKIDSSRVVSAPAGRVDQDRYFGAVEKKRKRLVKNPIHSRTAATKVNAMVNHRRAAKPYRSAMSPPIIGPNEPTFPANWYGTAKRFDGALRMIAANW